jgi:hypothetical protein
VVLDLEQPPTCNTQKLEHRTVLIDEIDGTALKKIVPHMWQPPTLSYPFFNRVG